MPDIAIDPVLLRALRGDGLGNARIATAGIAVAKGGANARARRAIGEWVSGDVTWMHGHIEAPVRIAQGVHWCGGTLQIVGDRHALPESVALHAVGKRLRDVIDHPSIPDDAVVTSVSGGPDPRFHVTGQMISALATTPPVTLLHTDARMVELRVGNAARLMHATLQTTIDAWVWGSASKPAIAFNVFCLLLMMGTMTMAAHGGMDLPLPLAVPAGIVMALAIHTVTMAFTGTMEGLDLGMAHLLFLRCTQDRQREEGMWGKAEEETWRSGQ